jgi:hypothetical protein
MTATSYFLYGSTRNLLLGAGTCYAIQREKYWHLPIVFVIPSIYAGYQAYKNKDEIKRYIKN